MPECIICLDCNRLFPRLPNVDARGRCPACRAARQRAQWAKPHAATPKRTAETRFYGTAAWRRLSRQVRARDGGCVRCGTTRSLTAHHLVSIHERADLALDPMNVETLCRSCHAQESNRARAA